MRETSRQSIVGKVISDKMDKTVVVQVESLKQHPKYKKFMRTRKNYKAHDGANECSLGDIVKCDETRPLSRDKRWRVVEILKKRFVSTLEVEDPDEMVMKKQKPAETAGEETAAEVEQTSDEE